MTSADAFLDQEAPTAAPSADDFLDQSHPLLNATAQILKPAAYVTNVIMKAFGNDNVPDLGLDKETVDAMKSSGEWNDYVKDHTDFHTALSDGVLKPTASDMQAAFIKGSAAPFMPILKAIPGGIEAGWQNLKNFATMADLPTPELDELKAKLKAGQPVNWKNYLGAFNEEFRNSPPGQAMGAIFNPISGAAQPAFNEASQLLEKAGIPHQVTETILNLSPLFGTAYGKFRPEPEPQFSATEGPWGAIQQTLTKAQAEDVIGQGIGEGQYMGTIGKTPEQAQASLHAAWQLPEEYQTPTIHEIARNIDPETFQEYDALARTRENAQYSVKNPEEVFGTVIDSQINVLKTQAAELSKAPIELEDEELHSAVQANIAAAKPIYEQIRQLEGTREQFIKDSTDEARQALQEADYRMRDLAPKVSQAYRDAQGRNVERFPVIEPEEPAKEEPAAAVPPAKTNTIAQDVSQKLVSAGRPQEEADAAAQLVQAHYEARADRFDGNLGTAEEMYDRDGAGIRAGKERARQFAQELEQPKKGSIRLATDDAKATITLMKSADASTFIHETGHHWLDELMNDAERDEAPEDLKTDAATVRKWLGVNEGEDIPTKAHEKFARGFERYMMEGTAPSRGLAGVFAQFKSWLTSIYQAVDKLRSPINDDIRDVFDRLLTKNPEKVVIAPEHEPGAMLATVHESDAAETPPERAALVRDNIEREIDHTAQLHEPEVHDVIKSAEAGSVAAQASGTGAPPEGEAGASPAAQESNAVAAGGGAPRAKSAPARGIYEEVPKKPLTLAEWISKNGGVQDEGGDIASMGGNDWHLNKNGRPRVGVSKLINPEGMPQDDAALKAWEAGYFPEKGDRPTIQEFQDKLAEEIQTGNPQFSHFDEAQRAAYENALERNAEIDRLANEYGIDIKGKTAAQFWEEFNDKHSRAEQDALIASQDEAAQAKIEEFERGRKEWLASRGEAWEPDDTTTRTEEDLEHEWEQEKAAGKLLSGEERPGGTGDAAEPPQPGETGNGQRPGSAPVAGRTTEIPDSPNARFGSESKYVDKAGNIRLDLLNTPDDIKQVLRDTAKENNDFLPERRGVISNGQTLDLADALGMDAAMLDMRKIGQAFNAEQIVAATKLLIQSATDVRDAMESGDAAAYLEAKARHQMIQGQVSGFTAEAGRALQIFQSLKKIEGYDQAKAVSDFLDQTDEGKTLFQLQEEMNFGKNLTTPEQVSKFIMDSSRHSFRNMILEYYVNSLISGPITHLRYAAGNALKALWTPLVETPVAATIGELREALGYEGDRVYYGESLAQLHGLMEGATKGWDAAVKAFQEGYSEPLPAERTSPQFLENMSADYAIPGKVGEIINLPSRSVSAIHSFFKALRYEQNIQGAAYRAATEEGLEGDAFTNRVADLTIHPTTDMMTEATESSLKQLYMAPTDYHSLTGILTRATNKYLMAKIMVPFMKIGGQITREAFMESTPLGFFDKGVNANLMGENGAVPRDMQIARITAGTALIGATVMLTAKGLATGDGPDDPSQRRVWLLTHKPNSLQVGDITIPYQGLGSLGMLMRFSANMTETAKAWDKESGDKLAVSFVKGISKSVLDENFMRGVNDALQAAYHPEEYGANYIKSFATNWLPFSVGLGQTAREIDPYHREAKTIFDAARAKIPIESEGLFPQRDIFGLPIPNGKPLTDYADDPVVQRMNALHIGVGKLEDKIRGVQLTPQQYDDYSRIAGNLAKARLDKLVAGQKFTSLPEAVQIEMMHKTISDMREMARQIVIKQNPQILNQAIAAKRIKEIAQ